MDCKIIKTGRISCYDTQFPYGAWPSVITLSNGNLYCAWSGNRKGHICPYGKVLSSVSSDGGYSWSKPKVVLDTPLDDRDAGLVELNGAIYLTSFNNSRAQQRIYYQNCKFDEDRVALYEKQLATVTGEGENRYLGSTIAKSTDGGKTFCDPVVLPITAPHGPIKLSDGSLLLIGRSFRDSEKASFDYLPEGIYSIKIHPDLTFDKPRLLLPEMEGMLQCEPHAIDLGDKILLGLRIEDYKGLFTIYHSYSYDGGLTFTTPQPTGYDGSPPHYYKHSSGAVLLSYTRRRAPFPTVVRVSHDNGVTFGDEIMVFPTTPTGDVGYPSSTENDRGEIVTVHYQKDEENIGNCIKYAIWRL